MIIVTTNYGTTLINDAEIDNLTHDKETATVIANRRNGRLRIPDVTDVQYVANTPIYWRDKGNAFVKLEKTIEDMKQYNEDDRNWLNFYRWSVMIYESLVSGIIQRSMETQYSDEYVRKTNLEKVKTAQEKIDKELEERLKNGTLYDPRRHPERPPKS